MHSFINIETPSVAAVSRNVCLLASSKTDHYETSFPAYNFDIADLGVIWQAPAPFDDGNHRTNRNVETIEVVGSIGCS